MLIIIGDWSSVCAKSLKIYADNFLYSSKKIENTLSLKLVWNHSVGCGSCGYYINLYFDYQDLHIFLSDYYGIVKKYNFDTGKCIWKKDLSKIVCNSFIDYHRFALLSSGVVVDKNYLYVGSELSKIYALDIKTGAILWISEIFGEVISRPVVRCGLVLVYTSNGVLQALDQYNGVVVWSINFDVVSLFSFRVVLLPAVSSNILIIGNPHGVVSACCIDTGELIWQTKIANLKDSTDIGKLSNIVAPVIVDNIVYAVAYNGNIVALDIFSGSVIWSKNIGSLINIIAENDIIYLVDQDNRILALNINNGNIIWSRSNLLYSRLSSIMLYHNYILIGDEKGYLYFLFKKDGSFFGKKKIGNSSFDQIMIISNKIAVYERSGALSVWELV